MATNESEKWSTHLKKNWYAKKPKKGVETREKRSAQLNDDAKMSKKNLIETS